MSEFFFNYGLFLAKAVTWVAAILFVVAAIANLVRHARQHMGGDHLDIKNLNDRFRDLADAVHHTVLTPDEFKQLEKTRKADDKARAKAEKKGQTPPRSRVFVLDFDGDLHASAVDSLREEISAVLQVAREKDEILLRLESEGGLVHGYGLAASQLVRIRDRKIALTAAVDKVAASGGYLMACVADTIVAAPFAIVGSIGVVAQMPNFNRLLKKHDVDVELHTAGQYKRTLTVFVCCRTAATDEDRAGRHWRTLVWPARARAETGGRTAHQRRLAAGKIQDLRSVRSPLQASPHPQRTHRRLRSTRAAKKSV